MFLGTCRVCMIFFSVLQPFLGSLNARGMFFFFGSDFGLEQTCAEMGLNCKKHFYFFIFFLLQFQQGIHDRNKTICLAYSKCVLLSTTVRVITVVKMLWTHEAQPSESTISKTTKEIFVKISPTRTRKCTPYIMLHVRVRPSCQKLFQTRSTCSSNAKKMLGKRVMTSTLVDKSTDHDIPHFDLFVFFLQQYQRQRKYFI